MEGGPETLVAIVTTALAFTRDYVPYERLPQPQTLWTAIPRGLQFGYVNEEDLDLKPVNDDQRLTVTMTLPPNFGYVMANAQLTITQNRANDWADSCNLNITNFLRGTPIGTFANYRQGLEVDGRFLKRTMVVTQPWPSFPIVGVTSGSPIIVVFDAWNGQDTAATAGTVSCFASFWQFDLEQIRKYPINSPQPVHSR